MPRTITRSMTVAALATLLASPSLSAQIPDYARADVIRTAARYVFGASVRPRFLEDSVRFWYTSSARDDRGVTYVVDPASGEKRPLFDNARLAAALSLTADTLIDPTKLPGFAVTDTGRTIEIQLRKKIFECGATTYACAKVDSIVWATDRALRDGPSWAARSPDDRWDVFLYDYNLYVRPASLSDEEAIAKRDSVLAARADTATADSTKADSTESDSTKAEPPDPNAASDSVALPAGSIQLTTDGAEHWGWENNIGALFRGVEPNRWEPRRVAVTWSPDSRKLALQRLDYRNLRKYPLYSSTKAQPVDKSYFYAVPGDTAYPQFDTYVVDIAAAVIPTTEEDGSNSGAIDPVKVNQPPSPAINFFAATQWSRTSDRLYTMSSSRGYKRMTVVSVDASSGAATEITRDSFPTWVESRGFRVVNGGEDILYISERDGWSHIYRFGADGTLKNQVESGPYAVDFINRVDSIAHQIYFTASGKEDGVPYYGHLYRVNFDGSDLTLLTPEPGEHRVSFVPKANYFIDTYATADEAPTIVLRSGRDGAVVMELMKGDVDLLASLGWTPPEVIQVKARDATTDLWGLVYRPSDFDSTKSYPIIDHIYPGPQVGSVGQWSFSARHEPRALAELGFIVLELDHMGTPGRSKAFHDFYFGNMGDNGLPDHIAAIRQLAARHRYIDIDRVGIYGHSGGGFASTDAILRYPDFFKVAVSGAGNHDNRTYGYFWGEKYQGLLDAGRGRDNYEASANYTMAANLKGKLLLMHGDMDNNVHPANTLRVVDALIKANRDFDMLIFPDAGHGLPDYSIRKRWDYFVRHLLGVEPPQNYQMMDRPPRSFF